MEQQQWKVLNKREKFNKSFPKLSKQDFVWLRKTTAKWNVHLKTSSYLVFNQTENIKNKNEKAMLYYNATTLIGIVQLSDKLIVAHKPSVGHDCLYSFLF